MPEITATYAHYQVIRHDIAVHGNLEANASGLAHKLGQATTEVLNAALRFARHQPGWSLQIDTLSITRSPGPAPWVYYILNVQIGAPTDG